jgi:hypothetical protein
MFYLRHYLSGSIKLTVGRGEEMSVMKVVGKIEFWVLS